MENSKVASFMKDNEQSVIMDSNDACVESSDFYTSSVMWKNIHMFDRTPEAVKRSQGPGSNLPSMISSSSDSETIFVPSPNYSIIGETGSDDNPDDFVSVVSRAHIFGSVKRNGFSAPKWSTIETQLPTLSPAQKTTSKATPKNSPHFTNTRAKFESPEKLLPSGALSQEAKGPSRTFSFDSSDKGCENNANSANVGAGYEGKVYTPRNNVPQYTNARARFESPEKLPPAASKRSTSTTNTQNVDHKRENCTTTLQAKSQSDRESRSLQPVLLLSGTTSSSKNIFLPSESLTSDKNGSPLVMTPRTAVLRAAGFYDSPTIKDTESDRSYFQGPSSKTQRYKDRDCSIANRIQCPSSLNAAVHNDDSVCSNLQQELERLNIKLSNKNENLLVGEDDDSSGPVSNLSKVPTSQNISSSIHKLNSAVKSATHLHSTNASTNTIVAPLHIQTCKSVGPRVEEMINRLSTPQRALRRSHDIDKSSASDSEDTENMQQDIEPKMDVHLISDSVNENALPQIHSQPPSFDRTSSIGDLKRNRRIKRTVRKAREGAMIRKIKERLWNGDEWLVSEVRPPPEKNDTQSETLSAESFQISSIKSDSSSNDENGMNSSNADNMNMQEEKEKEANLYIENCNDQEAPTTTITMENRQVKFIKLQAQVEPNEKDSTDYSPICVSQESSVVPILESYKNATSYSESPAMMSSAIASRSHLESISSIAQSPHNFPKAGLPRTPLSALPPKSPAMKAKLDGGDPASQSIAQAPRRYEPIRVPSPRKASAILRVSPREQSPSNAFIITSSQPGLSKELLADNLYGSSSDDASSSSCCSPTSTVGSQSYSSDEKSDMRTESSESIESVSPRYTNETSFDTDHVTSDEDGMKEAKQPTAMEDYIQESGESFVKGQKMDVPEKAVQLHDEVEREMIKEGFLKPFPFVHKTEDWAEEEFRINESQYKEEGDNTDAFVLRKTLSKGLFQKRIRLPKADRAKHGKPTTTVSQLLQRKQLEVALSKCDAVGHSNDASPEPSAKTGKHLWKRNRSKVTKRRVRFFR